MATKRRFNLGGGATHDATDHCSELETETAVDDCVPCSLVMVARAAGANALSTIDEAHALRKAAGFPTTGATGLMGHQAAFEKRYLRAYETSSKASLKSVLTPGLAAAVIGKLTGLPAGHPLRRHQPNFIGFHSVFIARLPDGSFLWDDPLAPEGTYAGEIVAEADAQAYYDAGAAERKIGFLTSRSSEVEMLPVTDKNPVKLHIAKGIQIFRLDGTPKVKVSVAQTVTSPFSSGDFRAIIITTAKQRQLLLVKTADATDIAPA
jgi:hypothetical protein